MFRRLAAFALVTALGVSASAVAQAPAPSGAGPRPNADLRCMIIANAIGGQSKDPRQKQEAQLMMIFYLGKVEARTPGLALSPALQAQDALLQAARPTPAQAQEQAKGCVSNFEGRMGALQALMRPPPGAAPAGPAATAPAPK